MNKIIGILFFLLVLSGACRKSELPGPVTTLLSRINSDPDLVILNAALQRLQIDTAFESGGPFTIFAPVDSAFVAAGITVQKINSYNIDSLKKLIGFHIVDGKVSGSDILGFFGKRFSSMSYYKPYISKNFYGIFINGIHVSEGNIACSDGVLHKIEGVCTPPVGNLYETILGRPDLTYSAELLRASPATAEILQIAGDSIYFTGPPWARSGPNKNVTAFIPTDDAFRSLGWTIDTIRQWIGNGFASNLINNGVVCKEYYTADFLPTIQINNGNDPASMRGYFDYGPQMGIRDNGRGIYFPLNYFKSRIIIPNVSTTNGALHIVDSVLVPYEYLKN